MLNNEALRFLMRNFIRKILELQRFIIIDNKLTNVFIMHSFILIMYILIVTISDQTMTTIKVQAVFYVFKILSLKDYKVRAVSKQQKVTSAVPKYNPRDNLEIL